MATKTVIANQKGGVGKTATALALSAFLSKNYGKKVLAIDLDPSSNMTIGFNIDIAHTQRSLTEVLEGTCTPEDAIVEISPNLHIIPTRPDLAATFTSGKMSAHLKRNEIVRIMLQPQQEKYDWIIIDTAPLARNVMTINGLAFADFAIIPCQMEELSVYGISQMVETIQLLHAQHINRDLKILGLLPTLYQGRTRVCKENFHTVQTSIYREYLLDTIIRRTASIPAALSRSKLITAMPRSAGYSDYLQLTDEIVQRTRS